MIFKARAITDFSDYTKDTIYNVEKMDSSLDGEVVYFLPDNKGVMNRIPASKFIYISKTSPQK